MPSFSFRELQLTTVLLLISDSYMSWRTRFVSLKLAQVFSCKFGEISKNTLSYRTPLVAASVHGLVDNKNVIILIKIKIIEKPHTVLLPNLLFLNCSKF